MSGTSAVDTAVDPICGMKVDKTSSLSAKRDGKTYHFCSDHCLKQFLSGASGAKSDGHSGGCCG